MIDQKNNTKTIPLNILVVDIETERLESPEKIWVAVTHDVLRNEQKTWLNLHQDSKEFASYISQFTLVGHNLLSFDLPVINRICGTRIPLVSCFDTLVLSRLFFAGKFKQHGLEAWGERLGFPKIEFNDFSQLTDEMVTYCQRDVELTVKLWKSLSKYTYDVENYVPIINEHRTAVICYEMNRNGFYFDIDGAKSLYNDIKEKTETLLEEIQKEFKPRLKPLRVIKPVLTKTGKLHSKDFRWLEGDPFELGYRADSSFTLCEWESFNPASTKQVIERLNECGWKPTEMTKGHKDALKEKDEKKLQEYQIYGWKISEENLETLPENSPESARKLKHYLLLTRRLTTLEEWFEAYNERTHRIHGTVNPIGTWTHRCSHTRPNTGNIVSTDKEYGSQMRAFWQAQSGYRLIGCDADAIQLRILAHYMDDYEFTQALVAGKKEEGTDAHTRNMKTLKYCKSRDVAKTFIYAWLLGASTAKIAQILECTFGQAKEASQRFLESYPGLQKLKTEIIPMDAKNGYFLGLDNRMVLCDSEHKMLAGYLQNGEKVIMSTANWLWRQALRKEKIDFKQVGFVHDEWQVEVPDDDEIVKWCAETMAESIKVAGQKLNLKCPLEGTYSVGYNWMETH